MAIIYGSLVEAIGTFTGKLSEFILEERLVSPKALTIAQSFIAGVITILGENIFEELKMFLGISLTGMYGVSVHAFNFSSY